MARDASTYRAARRNLARRAKMVWRTGRRHESLQAPVATGITGADGKPIMTVGVFHYGWHASMPQRYGVPVKVKAAA